MRRGAGFPGYASAQARERDGEVAGLALLCPLLAGIHDVPEHDVVVSSGDIGNDDFRDYFTVQTAETLERERRCVPGRSVSADQAGADR